MQHSCLQKTQFYNFFPLSNEMFKSKTLIIGIKTNVGKSAIVMLADSQVTDNTQKGLEIKHLKYNKIETGLTWAMADSGSINGDISYFYLSLRENPERAKRQIRQAIRSGKYSQILALNTEVARKLSTGDTHEFMLATQYPQLTLMQIDAFGHATEAETNYLLVGSASEKAKEYLEAQLTGTSVKSYELTLERALRLGYETVACVSGKDLNLSGPPSIVVVTQKRVKDFTQQHWSAIAAAEKKSLEAIIREINK